MDVPFVREQRCDALRRIIGLAQCFFLNRFIFPVDVFVCRAQLADINPCHIRRLGSSIMTKLWYTNVVVIFARISEQVLCVFAAPVEKQNNVHLCKYGVWAPVFLTTNTHSFHY